VTTDPSTDHGRTDAPPHRSYKARQGRISDLTARSISEYWSRYGVGDAPAAGHNPQPGEAPTVDLDALFAAATPRPSRTVVELGSGMGDTTVTMAAADPDTAVLAVEVHTRGVARLMRAAADRGLSNVRVASCDGQALLAALPAASLDGIRAFFPDPWPKARHHKRRLVRPEFATEVVRVLRVDGTLHLATDWVDYAEAMREVLDDLEGLANTSDRSDGFVDRPSWRPITKFEQTGLDKGHVVHDLIYRRVPTADPEC
jgi:tRNA (guanine-N7-)-methyltransferase